jgi:hypothetical protein
METKHVITRAVFDSLLEEVRATPEGKMKMATAMTNVDIDALAHAKEASFETDTKSVDAAFCKVHKDGDQGNAAMICLIELLRLVIEHQRSKLTHE